MKIFMKVQIRIGNKWQKLIGQIGQTKIMTHFELC